jgi:hypothetical protein
MRAAARAWQLREAARTALGARRVDEACALAARSLGLHDTPRGRRLLVLALLAAGRAVEARRAATGATA